MQVIYDRCCGLDVHKRTITACVLKWLGGEWHKEILQHCVDDRAHVSVLALQGMQVSVLSVGLKFRLPGC